MITEVRGVRVGHATDVVGRTGCTVILFPGGTVASGEVRGGAPGTREWALLAPERTVSHIDAVVLCGGSALGLGACDGVARWCEERGVGVPTPSGVVPIVVGAVLYDRGVGDPTARPTAASGYAACVAAVAEPFPTGGVGAAAGATLGKWRGPDAVVAAGLGSASMTLDALVVGAVVAVNAWGDVRASAEAGDAGAFAAALSRLGAEASSDEGAFLRNTTIGVIATNAALDKGSCLLVAQSGHDGLARALEPVHGRADGDALVAAATGGVDAPVDVVRVLAARAVEAAVHHALD